MRSFWTIVVVLVAAGLVQAGETGGSFSRDGIQLSYSVNDWEENQLDVYLHAHSEKQLVDEARVWIYPDEWRVRDDGLPTFQGTLSVGGVLDEPLGSIDRSVSFHYNRNGVRVNQYSSLSAGSYETEPGQWTHWNSGGASISLLPSVIEWASGNYYEWTEGGGGGGGGGKGVIAEEVTKTHWNYDFRFSGYFLDAVGGREFLASIPEPATLLLFGIGSLGFCRRRR